MVFTEQQRAFLVEKSTFKDKVRALRGKARDPEALAAYISRKKYGKDKFQKMAAKGRKR